jgi:DNA repair exonuclease SbcCD ATPase subunit|tara:strand:- start:3916 stop:5586 length:1671 start_codon:yes stop_codon:yes gene_type:complete
MRINFIEFKNFASYGNQIQRIQFEEDESKLFLTLGKNGDGKTTIANAIIYALYGRVEGVKLSDLPNRINKELHVKIGLTCGTINVEIERGLLPNKFSVKLNGIEFDKAGKKSVQDYLEEEVFGIPYHVFKNIIILSVNDFKSFLTMSNQDKKQIIDKMFGFSILNDMQMSIKTERRAVKMEIDSYEGELNQIIDSIASVRGRLNTLLEESQQKNNSKIDELKTSLISLNESVKILDIDKKEIETLITGNTGVYETTRSVASKTKHEIEYLKRKLELYESGKCPTCETQLDSQWHLEQKEHFCTKIESETSNIKILKENLEDIKSDIEILKGQKRDIEKNTSDIRYNMKAFRSELLKIKDTPDDTQFEHLKNLIKDFEKKEDIKSTNKGNLSADHAFMEIVENVLGEDGVKNLAVKTILPGLNSNIAAMAQTMHLQFHIRFDEKFNCIINHLGEDINPMTLSTGERKKADFIIIIAIIKILKLRFPQLNLLFLDELLSSVDHDGVYNILKILNQVIKENNLNTFVINHSVLPHEIFDKKLQIYRENGFSKFTIESIE